MYQIQISRRRQKFTTVYTFEDSKFAEFWFAALQVGRNERKRVVRVEAVS